MISSFFTISSLLLLIAGWAFYEVLQPSPDLTLGVLLGWAVAVIQIIILLTVRERNKQ